MIYTLIRHKVKSYIDMKFVFVDDAPTRKASGSQGGQLFRNVQDPDEIVVLFAWESMEKAQEFMGSEHLKEAMGRAGVVGIPDVRFLEMIEAPSS